MIKTVCVKRENGDVFTVDAKFIAMHRANDLAEYWRGSGLSYDETYKEEYASTMSDDDELASWLFREMSSNTLQWYDEHGKKAIRSFEIGTRDEIYVSHR